MPIKRLLPASGVSSLRIEAVPPTPDTQPRSSGSAQQPQDTDMKPPPYMGNLPTISPVMYQQVCVCLPQDSVCKCAKHTFFVEIVRCNLISKPVQKASTDHAWCLSSLREEGCVMSDFVLVRDPCILHNPRHNTVV